MLSIVQDLVVRNQTLARVTEIVAYQGLVAFAHVVYAVVGIRFTTHGALVSQLLVDMCQRHLIEALHARIRATEQAVGQRFAFEVVHLDHATAFFAHQYLHANHNPPFHRVFDYRAPASTLKDPLLDRLVDERIDAVIEVVPGAYQEATAQLL